GATAFRVAALRAPDAVKQPLLGRERERQRYAELLRHAASAHQGAVVLIRADPGMGKTRLCEALLADSATRGAACHVSTVFDFGTEQGRDAIYALTRSLLDIRSAFGASARREALDRALALGHVDVRSEEHTSELQSPYDLVCRLLLEKK